MTTPGQPDPMGGVVSGSADLQASIDRLDNAVNALTTAIQGSGTGSGMSQSPAMASSFAAQGVTFSGGTYPGAGGGSGFLGTGAYNGGNNGSGGTSGTNPFSFAGGGVAQAAVNIGSDIVNNQFKQGVAQLNNQAIINAYGYTQAAFWNVSSQSAILTGFGGGSGANLSMNNMATSASDARIGGQLLSQISGQANYTAGAGPTYGRGNSPFQLAASTAFANPGLGAANSAGIAGAFYNPSTSYNLMMMGVANTPLQLGTGRAQNMAGVEAAIGQRFGFQGFNANNGTFNSQNLAANLNNPLFQMQIMEATGMSQQQYNVWSQQWAMLNNAAISGHTTMNQMQNQISQYMNGSASQQKSAQSWLTQHGVQQSLLQSMTQANAAQTGAEAGGNQAFTDSLQAATTQIDQFTAALSKGLQEMDRVTGGTAAVGSLNSSGVIGAGGGGITNTAINALISAGNGISNFIKDVTGGSSGGAGSGDTGAHSTNAAQNQAMAKNIIAVNPAYRGWNQGQQWQDLLSLWNMESGWSDTIANASSGAAGIAQNIQGWSSSYQQGNAAQQINWGLNYIKGRYGSPSAAWQHEMNTNPHWYADGTTSAKPGMALVGERGPELVSLSGGQQVLNAAQTAKMMQPKFGGGMDSPGGFFILFQNGAITINNSGVNATSGNHTSADVQSTAAQLTQAIEKNLAKSSVLRNIAAGVTG